MNRGRDTRVIILDASVLVGHFGPADAHHAEAAALLKADAGHSFAFSVVTLAELYVGASRAGQACCWVRSFTASS
jgi:predicted nucleic acid-binding protein